MKHIAELTADPHNRRLHNPRNIGLLVDALHQVGAARSIVIDEHDVILAGNGVVEAAGEAGITKLQVVEADGETVVAVRRRGLTEAQKRALALYDNRTAELATWNVEQLLLDQTAGLELKAFWTDEELAALLNGNGGPKAGRTDPDAVPEVRATEIQRGDLFELGAHRLLCGDATVAADVARIMGEEEAGAVVADPPYGVSIVRGRNVGGAKPFGSVVQPAKSHIIKPNVYSPITGDDKPFDPSHLLTLAPIQVLFGANYYADKLPISSCWIVWDKREKEMAVNDFAECELAWSNIKRPARVFRHLWMGLMKGSERGEARVHPTQKPVALFVWVLSEIVGDTALVLDPYLGSGTTLIAAEQLNRTCRAIEIEPQYCQVTLDRWEAFTGQKAVKVGDAVREPPVTRQSVTHGKKRTVAATSSRRKRRPA
jgi:hypothetical protein